VQISLKLGRGDNTVSYQSFRYTYEYDFCLAYKLQFLKHNDNDTDFSLDSAHPVEDQNL